ncbi:hypothetical protein AMECASPLE_005937, partial [Ameca splendens]
CGSCFTSCTLFTPILLHGRSHGAQPSMPLLNPSLCLIPPCCLSRLQYPQSSPLPSTPSSAAQSSSPPMSDPSNSGRETT